MPLFRNAKVSDAMTERPRAVVATMTASEAAEAMTIEDVGALPVVDEGKVVGIVTDRDLVTRVLAQGLDPRTTTVAEVASCDVVVVRPDDDLEVASDLMARHQIRRLAVVEDGENVVGMLSQADLAAQAGSRQVGEVVEGISEPVGRGPRV